MHVPVGPKVAMKARILPDSTSVSGTSSFILQLINTISPSMIVAIKKEISKGAYALSCRVLSNVITGIANTIKSIDSDIKIMSSRFLLYNRMQSNIVTIQINVEH